FLALDDMPGIERISRFFGYNRIRALSVNDRDYLRPGNMPISEKLDEILCEHRLKEQVDSVYLLTSPKILGFAFNPVSFFFCFSSCKRLVAVIAEVRNTFDEKILYLLQDQSGPALYCLKTGELSKRFYVSPFNKVDGEYDFDIRVTERDAKVVISYNREGHHHFTATLTGRFTELSAENICKSFLTIAKNTVLILPRIILEAIKLHYLKKLPVQRKPLLTEDFAFDLRQPKMLEKASWKVINRYLTQFTKGRIVVELPNGERHEYGDRSLAIPAVIKVKDYSFFRDLILQHDIGLGEAYVSGKFEVDDLTLMIKHFIANIEVVNRKTPLTARLAGAVQSFRHALNRNNKSGSKRNIHAHYDLSNELFENFLDRTMTYSSGLFLSEDDDLEQAQRNKLDRIAQLAQLKKEDHVLEIGCGWGSFAIHAAENYGCKVTGITLSQNQLELARRRVRAAGLEDLVTLKLIDYRDVVGKFDKIVSVEMIEAVGHQYYPTFFKHCDRLLKPDGLMVLQAITIPDYRFKGAAKGADWIQKHIFPGSTIPSLTALSRAMEKSSCLTIESSSHFGKHYARTLREWRVNFDANEEAIRSLGYDTRFIRTWRYYLSYCEAGFDSLYTGLYHIRFTRPMNASLAVNQGLSSYSADSQKVA
ncbi:MAG: DUF1365 family protein, partial [Bdellovibrionales bacterium]|nr:DUF1365 family protein [Bdellovibrionales bacterium]